jgi:hypothetical protein
MIVACRQQLGPQSDGSGPIKNEGRSPFFPKGCGCCPRCHSSDSTSVATETSAAFKKWMVSSCVGSFSAAPGAAEVQSWHPIIFGPICCHSSSATNSASAPSPLPRSSASAPSGAALPCAGRRRRQPPPLPPSRGQNGNGPMAVRQIGLPGMEAEIRLLCPTPRVRRARGSCSPALLCRQPPRRAGKGQHCRPELRRQRQHDQCRGLLLPIGTCARRGRVRRGSMAEGQLLNRDKASK